MTTHKSLKILHLTTHLNIGGISSYLLMLGSSLIRQRYDIGVLSSGGSLSEDFRTRHFKLHEFSIRTKNELHPKLFLALPKIIRLVRQESYDLLHAHTRVTQVLAHFVSSFTQVPYVTTAHGFFKPRLGRKLFGCWGRRVIAISPTVAEDLKSSHRVQESRIRVVQNAVDSEEFKRKLSQKDRQALRSEYGIPSGAVVLASVSRLVEDKGHGYLMQAVQKLRQKFPNIFLVILGDGREKENLKKLALSLSLEDNITMIPALKDTTAVLAMADVFVHPATYREGFGLAIAEAMIAKKPVVATDIWAVNSIIRDGVNGFLVEPKNADGLVKKISFVIENPAPAAAAAERAYQMAEKLCSLERMVRETQAVYEEVVQENDKDQRTER